MSQQEKNIYPFGSFPFNLTRRAVGELHHLVNLEVKEQEYVQQLKGEAAIYAIFPHAGHLDGWITYVVLQNLGVKRIASLAAKDYFFNNKIRIFETQLVTPAYPMPRPDKTRNAEDVNELGTTFEELRGLLLKPDYPWSIVLAPEGTRSNKDFSDRKLKAGVAELALTTGASLVPVVISGAETFWRKDALLPNFLEDFPNRKKITMEFGKPLVYERVLSSDSRMRHEVLAELKERYAQMYLR